MLTILVTFGVLALLSAFVFVRVYSLSQKKARPETKLPEQAEKAAVFVASPSAGGKTLESAELAVSSVEPKEPQAVPAEEISPELVQPSLTEMGSQKSAAVEAEAGLSELVEESWLKRLSRGLHQTNLHFIGRMKELFDSSSKMQKQALKDHIEEILYTSDIGPQTVQFLLDEMDKKLTFDDQLNFEKLKAFIQEEMKKILTPVDVPFDWRQSGNELENSQHEPFVVLVVGVNGAGKTTTIGKLAQYYKLQNRKVLLAAGDTFRAAAVEQLKIWGERNDVEVIAQKEGADPASILFDAAAASKARKVDLLLADTAGRLHTKENLMEELKKAKRVMQKVIPKAPQEVLLVIDASSGQNALLQAREFHKQMQVTGLVLTKLDGTSKGGVVLGIANELKIPIRFIGVGEKLADLQPFKVDEFVQAFFEA